MSPEDLAALQAARDRLVLARMSGVREVRDQNGESVAYRSDAEMAAAIRAADRLLTSTPPHTIRFNTSKGLYP